MGDGLFGDLPAIEVPLTRAPLTRVLAQVRFPSVSELALSDGQHRFSRLLKATYPVARQQSGINLVITPQGVMQQPGRDMIWQLQDKSREWQVSFSDGFVSLETSKYVSRDDFCARLHSVLNALVDVAEPVLCDRIGIRYINQISGESLLRVNKFFRPEMLGGWAVSQRSESANLVQSLSESLFELGVDRMLIRSGWIPARGTVEPSVPALPSDSWVLDLDSFTDNSEDFSPAGVSARVRELADGAYRAFRNLVTDDFLEHYA
ncbi:TIGR04255 family protein [Streptomyces sp. YPW6]|uniref:TIGR04255 family protein n=1 Tax=Streptomyces sp. YPW6 TaxID=2840373 RepID=UPI001C0AA7E2|nr:TIGR04255 family protein [Streptomyces sp. YPW6]QWQ42281.1 TIGR04255 family protein [Streptomyces sp. YPW6]